MRRLLLLGITVVHMALLPLPALARDLQGRLGIGYNSEFVNSVVASRVPGVSVKYALTRDIAVAAIVGTSTASPSNSVTAVKFFKNLFLETNLNFYSLSAENRCRNPEVRFGVLALWLRVFIPGLEKRAVFEAAEAPIICL